MKAKGWICSECGHEVLTMDGERPEPIKWTDGHVCKTWNPVPEDWYGPDDIGTVPPTDGGL